MTDNNVSQPQTKQPSKPQGSQASAGNDRSNEKNQANVKTAPGGESQKHQAAQKQDKPAQAKKS